MVSELGTGQCAPIAIGLLQMVPELGTGQCAPYMDWAVTNEIKASH